MMQEDVERGQEFHKCIECFLCQDVCHVIRDHEEKKTAFSGPALLHQGRRARHAPARHASTAREFVREQAGIGLCNITKCCTEVCPEHIHITDNGIIPLKERWPTNYDPVVWVLRKLGGGRKKATPRRMKIHEYQAKALLREFGVPVPDGDVADDAGRGPRDRPAPGRPRGREGAGPRGRPRQGAAASSWPTIRPAPRRRPSRSSA